MCVKEYEAGTAAGGELGSIELIFGIGIVMREGRPVIVVAFSDPALTVSHSRFSHITTAGRGGKIGGVGHMFRRGRGIGEHFADAGGEDICVAL